MCSKCDGVRPLQETRCVYRRAQYEYSQVTRTDVRMFVCSAGRWRQWGIKKLTSCLYILYSENIGLIKLNMQDRTSIPIDFLKFSFSSFGYERKNVGGTGFLAWPEVYNPATAQYGM